MTTTARRRSGPDLSVVGLLLLSAVPVIAGSLRLTELAGSPAVTTDNARFVAVPLPVVLHIVGASLYCVLGAFQFSARWRRRRIGWHRVAGRLLVPCGIVAALSGLWMTLFSELPSSDGDLLGAFRVVFGTAMIASIVLGLRAVLRKDIPRHRAWMTRGYAIGLGAGTQVFTIIPWSVAVGVPGPFAKAWLMLAGWVINLVVAEWLIGKAGRRATVTA